MWDCKVIRKYCLLVSISFLAVTSVYSQELVDSANHGLGSVKTGKPANYLMARGRFDLNSSSLPNALFHHLLFNKDIDDGLKDDVASRLKDINRAGMDFSYDFSFLVSNTNRRDYFIQLEASEILSGRFPGSALELLMYGNKPFAGLELGLDPLSVDYIKYQSIGIGTFNLFHYKDWRFGGILSIVRGADYKSFSMSKGDFFTEQYGRYIELTTNLQYRTTPSRKFGSVDFPGLGLSAGLMAGWHSPGYKHLVNFYAFDLGAIRWPGTHKYTIHDTAYHFSGIEIDNLFATTDSVFTGNEFGSVTSFLGADSLGEDYWGMLPAHFMIEHYTNLSYRIRLVNMLDYKLTRGYLPKLRSQMYFRFSDQFLAGPTLVLGGFGRFDMGSSVVYMPTSKWEMQLYLTNLTGNLVFPAKSSGVGLWLVVRYGL